MIHYFSPILILWSHSWHLYQHHFLYFHLTLLSILIMLQLFSLCSWLLAVALLTSGFNNRIEGLRVEESCGNGDNLCPPAFSYELFCGLVVVGDCDCVEDEALSGALLGRGEAKSQWGPVETAQPLLGDKQRWLPEQLYLFALGVLELSVVKLDDAFKTWIFLPSSPIIPLTNLFLHLSLHLVFQRTIHAEQ